MSVSKQTDPQRQLRDYKLPYYKTTRGIPYIEEFSRFAETKTEKLVKVELSPKIDLFSNKIIKSVKTICNFFSSCRSDFPRNSSLKYVTRCFVPIAQK